ncbi:MAG TPA: DUF6566 family protein [Paraburkholderia sp.]
MHASRVSYGEFEIVAHPERNEYGAWVAGVSVSLGTRTVVDIRPKTVQPEWLTEEEAIRDGVEWGRRFIDREFNSQQSRSWVADRSRAEQWFSQIEKSRG